MLNWHFVITQGMKNPDTMLWVNAIGALNIDSTYFYQP